jgi:hypothetical protein
MTSTAPLSEQQLVRCSCCSSILSLCLFRVSYVLFLFVSAGGTLSIRHANGTKKFSDVVIRSTFGAIFSLALDSNAGLLYAGGLEQNQYGFLAQIYLNGTLGWKRTLQTRASATQIVRGLSFDPTANVIYLTGTNNTQTTGDDMIIQAYTGLSFSLPLFG